MQKTEGHRNFEIKYFLTGIQINIMNYILRKENLQKKVVFFRNDDVGAPSNEPVDRENRTIFTGCKSW